MSSLFIGEGPNKKDSSLFVAGFACGGNCKFFNIGVEPGKGTADLTDTPFVIPADVTIKMHGSLGVLHYIAFNAERNYLEFEGTVTLHKVVIYYQSITNGNPKNQRFDTLNQDTTFL